MKEQDKEYRISERMIEQLKKDLDDEDLVIRTGSKKMSIFTRYERNAIEFWRKKNGKIEIKFKGFHDDKRKS